VTTTETIVCAIVWTVGIAGYTAVQLQRARRRSTPRYDVEWHANGSVFNARGLTEGEFDALTKRLKREGQPDA
jgi:hypothetical protein